MLPLVSAILNVGRVVAPSIIRGVVKRAFSSPASTATTTAVGIGIANDPEAMIEKATHLPEWFYETITGDEANLYNFISEEDLQKLLQGDIDEDLKAKVQNEVFWDDLKDRIRELPENDRLKVYNNLTKTFFDPKWIENPNATNIDKTLKYLKLFDEGVKGRDHIDFKDLPDRLANLYILSKGLDGNIDNRDLKSIKENLQNIPLVSKQIKDRLESIQLADNYSGILFLGSLAFGGVGGLLKIIGRAPTTRKLLLGLSGGTFIGGAGTEILKELSLEKRPVGEVISDPETYFNLWGIGWAGREILGLKEALTFDKNYTKYIQDRADLEKVKVLEGNTVKDFIENKKRFEYDYTYLQKVVGLLDALPEDVRAKVEGSGLKPLQNLIGDAIKEADLFTEEEKRFMNKTLFEALGKLPYHLEDISITSKSIEKLVENKLDKIVKVSKGELDVLKEDKELKEFFDKVHDIYFLNRLKKEMPSAKKITLQALHDEDIVQEVDLTKINDWNELLDIAKKFGDEYGSYRVRAIVPEKDVADKYVEKAFNVQRYYVPTNDRFILVKDINDEVYTIPKTYIDNGIIGYVDDTGKFKEINPKEFIVPVDNVFPYLKKAFLKTLEGDTKALKKILSDLEKTEFRAIKVEKTDELDKVLDSLKRNKDKLKERLTKLEGKTLTKAKILLDDTPMELRHKTSQLGFVKLDALDKEAIKTYLTNKYKNSIVGSSVKIVRDVYRLREYIDKVWGKQLDKKPILKSLAEAIDSYIKSNSGALGTIHKFTATIGGLNTMLNPAIKIANTINALMTLKMFMPESFKVMRLPEWKIGKEAGVRDWLSISAKDSASLNKLSMLLDPFSILNESYVIGLIAKASKEPKFLDEASNLLGISKETLEETLKTEPDKLYRMIYHTISGFNTFALPTKVLATNFSKANALINWYPFIVKPFANSLEMIKSVVDAKDINTMMKNAGRLAGVSLVGWFTLGDAGVPITAPIETANNIAGQVAGFVGLLTGNDTLEDIALKSKDFHPVSYLLSLMGLEEARKYLGSYMEGLGEVLTGYLIHKELIGENSKVIDFIRTGADFIATLLEHDLADLGIASAGAGSFAMDIPLLNLKVINDLVFYFKSKAMGIDLPATYLLRDIAFLNNIGKYVLGTNEVAGWEVEKPIVYGNLQDTFKEAIGLSYIVGTLLYIGDLATSGYISKVAYSWAKDPDKDKLIFKTKLNSTKDFSKMEGRWEYFAKGVIKLYEVDREAYDLFVNRYIKVNEKLLEKYIKTYTNKGEIDYNVKHKIENSLKFLSVIVSKVQDERLKTIFKGYSLLAERLGINLDEKDLIKLKGALSGGSP